MFHVPEDLKADYATLHFKGNAALWLQTYEANHDIDNWVALCVAVCSKFGKDLYYNSMNQALDIRQTITMSLKQLCINSLATILLWMTPSL